MHVGKISASLNPLTYIIVNAGIIAVIWFGGIQVNVGDMTQGEVIALVNYMTQTLLALVALANLIITFTKALASAGRINEVFAMKPGIVDGNEKESAVQQTEEQKTAEIRIQRDHRLAVRWADQTSSKGNAAAGEEGAGFFKENIQFWSWKSFRNYQERTGNYRKAVHETGRPYGYGSTGCHFSGGCV